MLAAGPARAERPAYGPQVAGEAGDLFDDIGFGRTDPWRFARCVAIGLGLVVFLAAAVQGDPFDGALNAAAEALACLSGFRTLRPLSRPSSLASIGGECPSPKQRPISPT